MRRKTKRNWRMSIRYWFGWPTVSLKLKSGSVINLHVHSFKFEETADGDILIDWGGSHRKRQLVWVDLTQLEAVEFL